MVAFEIGVTRTRVVWCLESRRRGFEGLYGGQRHSELDK